MANRYDIIRIDFQASAKGANTAIESIRQEAEQCNNKITELKKNIAEAPKNGVDAKIVEDWNAERKITEKRFRQFSTAYKELIKGMRALDEGVKMFNDGSLSQMNAAFQKNVNNAAKLAQSKLKAGTDEWRQMGALMQETEQNYARMQRDTDQLIESLQNGGTVFLKTIEDEKKGLQDLLRVLPYMGTEYRKAQEQLQFLVKTTDEMAIKEKQLKGEIVTTDDARRVSIQLTEKGAEAARQRAAAADMEIEKGKQEIETLEKEREEREKNARLSAQAAAEYRENQRMHEDEIERLDAEMRKEEDLAKSKRNGLDALQRKAMKMKDAAEAEKNTQKELDGVYDAAKEKVAKLREEVEKLRQGATGTPAKDTVAEAVKTGAEEAAGAIKQETEAKKEEVKVEKEAVEEQKKEVLSEKELEAVLKENKKVIDDLYKERDELIKKQKESAQATREEANAFAELSKEQAEAMLKQKQATVIKGADGKFAYTNAEEAQHFLIESMRQVNPGGANKDSASLDSAGVAKVRAMFMERYGITDDADALTAIRGLISGKNGSLIKQGMMNNAFSRIDLDASKVAAYSKEIKDLTDVINGEVKATKEDSKAVEENAEKKRTLADVDAEIEAREKEQRQNAVLLIKMRNGLGDSTSELSKKNEGLAESHKKSTAAIKEEIEAIKQMNREQAEAKKKEMTTTSTLGWKAGKLDASNLEEVQHFLLTQISKKGTVGKDGTYSLAGQNVDNLLTAFQNKYGLSGKKQEAKQILKELASGKSGGLFQEGGIIDFNNETMLIKANTEAYQARIQKLKALFDITNGTAQAVGKSTEATKKDTEATLSQTDAIKAQEAEVKRRKKAFDDANTDYDTKNAKLKDMRSALGRLPKSGPDALLARQQAKDEIDEYNENFVKPARAEKTKLKGLWEKSVRDLLKMQAEETTAENQNTEATERNTKAKDNKTKASEGAAKATGEETQKSAELLAKEKELKDAEEEEATAKKNAEDQQKKTTKAVNDATDAETKANDAEKKYAETMKGLNDERQKHVDGLKELNEANKDTIKTNEENQKLLKETNGKIREQGERIRAAEQIKAQAKTDGIEKTEQAIRLLTEENDRIDQNSSKWKRNTVTIQHLQEALDEMKNKPVLMMMEQRMKNVGALSASAVTETKKFWEAMVAGAEKGSESLKHAEVHLKTITEEEQKRNIAATKQQARGLFGDLSKMNGEEIRQAIDAGRKLISTYESGSPAAERLSKAILDAEEHLKNYGIEAERNARREAASIEEATKRRKEQDLLMRQQLDQGTSLSESALKTQQQYWQRLIDDPKTAKESLAGYRYELERTMELQEKQTTTTRNERAARLNGNLADMSEGEIREAIEAGKQLIQTYKSGSIEAETLAKKIVAAEEHVKQYGVEAQRAAVREAKAIEEAKKKREEADDAMEKQLEHGKELSHSALKAQENYWRKLIDDPKTAAESLEKYRENLAKVNQLQEQMAADEIRTAGEGALERFRNDSEYAESVSATALKERTDALKKYRDSLPKKENAELIKEIDGYLVKAGASAQKSAEQLMDFEKAKELALQAGDDVYGKNNPAFLASPEEIQAATKSIEKYREELFKTIKQKKDMGEATDAEEAELQELAKYLKDLKFEQDNFNMSREKMEALMNTPVNATSIDELRAAIKRADGELKRMEGSLGQNNAQYKAFAEQVRNAKNVMKEMEGQAKSSATAWEKAFSRLKTYVVMYMGFNEVWQKITGTMGDMLELSDKMGEVMKTTQFSADQVARLSDNLKELDTRTSMVKLMELSSIAGSIGLKTQEQVEGFTDAANQLMVALPEMGTEAARTLMKIADATGDLEKNGGDVRETLERVGSTIIALRANSAAAAGPITDFVSRVGAVGAQAGISIDQIAALGATVDALGGRVEMSATALSRMIPAIRNNSFAVANAIGMAEQDLKKMTAMEQMVAIFKALRDSVKQFDTSTDEGMNAMADKVEQMLGNSASMQEVMKTLNQQGARAGIVFGLLSQNVDKLEDQLTTATGAYRDNTALMEEYNKMNDTAAARWERLKNQLEEFFVTADNTSWLADIISGLRVLVDIITEEGPIGRFFRWSLVYLGMWQAGWTKTIGGALISLYQYIFATGKSTAATAADTAAKAANAAATEAQAVASGKAAEAQGRFNATMKANIVAAVATAVVALGFAVVSYIRKAKDAARQTGILEEAEKQARIESTKQRAELEKLYKATQDQTKSMEERKNALKQMVGDAKYKEYYSKLNTESELAKAAAEAYKDLAAQIIATARARALDAKAEELQQRRIKLEDEKADREQWRKDNQEAYDREQAKNEAAVSQQARTETAGAAGVNSKMGYVHARNTGDTGLISKYQGNEQRIKRIDTEIGEIDNDLTKLEEQVKTINPIATGDGNGGGGGGGTNPYGQYDRVTDPYSKWNGDDLVARRKEMLVRVRALANGADVQKVLSEDAKFISEAVRKNIKTTDQAIEWYNAERLKIQEALYNKHLTPTGDWLDPKKGAGNWRKQLQTDFDNYLRILDAYYTERKAHIEKAQAEEGLSEAEAQRLTVENETVWRKHRMELQQIYLGKSADIAEDERQRIYNILAEQDEDSADMVEKQIAISINKLHLLAQKSEVEARKIETKLRKDIATDLYKQQNAVSKQMEAIEKIISEERPFDGITKNLRDNLSTMGVLFADFDKKRREAIERGEQPEDDMAERAKQMAKRLSVVLDGVPDAYRMTFDKLKEVMIKEGFGEWAKAIEGDEQLKLAMMAQIRKTYDQVQEAIRKEAALIKKHADNLWNDALTPDGKSMKNQFEAAISQLGLQADQVKRANSLIGAGVASDRVANRLVIQQMKVQLAMERARFALMHKIGEERIRQEQAVEESLRRQGKLEEAKRKHADIENMQKSLGLAISEEQKKVDEQRVAMAEKLEETQNRLYQSLKEWATLFTSSIQSLMEASNAGNEEYYNERAKLDLTGKGGPGAGTYVVIDNAGTSDATAHYEYLDERQALERQRDIEQENAEAAARKKVMDDINMKMSEQITDWINASMQNYAIDMNTEATRLNTDALRILTERVSQAANGNGANNNPSAGLPGSGFNGAGGDSTGNGIYPSAETGGEADTNPLSPLGPSEGTAWTFGEIFAQMNEQMVESSNNATNAINANFHSQGETAKKENHKIQIGTESMFAKMTSAANMYGMAYQVMSNNNLSTSQKVQLLAVQAAGQAAISALTATFAETNAETTARTPSVFAWLWSKLGWGAIPVFALFTGGLGALMGLATSAITKSKSQIAKVTGASVSAGRLATGMQTYAEGNVNEMTDPSTLTPGRHYNVDGSDGKTYRARYMGEGAKTHITSGPEFHLVGEKGQEAIIDAHTTRLIRMNDTGIWRDIQTLYNGGSLSAVTRRRRGGGMKAFAEGNLEELDGAYETHETNGTYGDLDAMTEAMNRQSAVQEALLERLREPIVAQNIWTGPNGIPNMYNKMQKEAVRHGVKYL